MTSEPPEAGDQGEDLEADTEVEDAMKNGLKRSCSAPMINQLVAAEEESRARRELEGPRAALHSWQGRPRPSYMQAAGLGGSRWRRSSTSTCSTGPAAVSPVPGGRDLVGAGWSRLHRLKVEETKNVSKAEIQTEREVQRGLSMENTLSQSWEDLSLVSSAVQCSACSAVQCSAVHDPSIRQSDGPKETKGRSSRRSAEAMQPLTIGVGPFPSPRTSPSPRPSPTRSSVPGKQCFSPSMQMPVPNLSFSPSPSSSPTRRGWTSRRSLSPITLRPSPLGPVKRKCVLGDDAELGATPSKRHSSLLSITPKTRSPPRPLQPVSRERAAPYRLPLHVSAGWATPSSPSHSAGPASDHSGCSRESSPSPAPAFPPSPSPSGPSLMDTSTNSSTETSL
jgi:hypothetical protein